MAEKTKKSIFETPLFSTKIKSANAKIFPEGGLGYFIGPTLALIANSVLSGYLNLYLTNVLNMNAWAKWFVTFIPLISVVFVVLGNILVGRLIDKNKTRAGKARPILLLSLPISILALLFLFIFPPYSGGSTAGNPNVLAIILLAVGYNLWFAVAYPFYYTPHAALIGLSTRNSKDRSLLATISNATVLAAMGLSSMILPFFLGLLFKYDLNPSAELLAKGAQPYIEDGNIVYYFIEENGAKNILYDGAASYGVWKYFVIGLIAITVLGVIVEYYFTRERVTEESFAFGARADEEKKSVPIKKQAKVCFKDKFWVIMIIFFFLYQLGGMLKNVSQLYYCQAWFPKDGIYSVENGGTFHGTLSIIGAIPTAVGMLIAWPLSNKIGKGKAILFGALLATLGGAIGFLTPFVPENARFAVTVAAFVVKALGSTPAMYLSLALLADINDHQEAVHGFRTDGLTMTIYGAIMAGMTGIATGIMNGVLGAVGYSASNVASPAIQQATLWIFIGGETICYLVIGLLFIMMKVEKFSKFDHEAITEDQKAKCEVNGIEYVDAVERQRREDEQAEKDIEAAKIQELKAKCEKKNLDFDVELAKYQEEKAAKDKAAADKKAAADAKKEEKAKAKAEAAAKKEAALSEEQKAAKEKAAAEKAEKDAAKDAIVKAEFDAIRASFEEERKAELGI